MPFNTKAFNTCTSSCMDIYESRLIGQYVEVRYNKMPPTCFLGVNITISCRGFFNPIY